MRIRFFFFLLFLAVAVAGYWFIKAPASSEVKPVEPVQSGVAVGKSLEAFSLLNLEGQRITVGEAGKVTIVNFWASWCPPCREEMPELNRFAAKHKDTVFFYGVNLQEPTDKVKEFMQQYSYSFPVLIDSTGEIGKFFRVTAIPTTLVVDKKGMIVFRKSGTVTMSELEGIIKDL